MTQDFAQLNLRGKRAVLQKLVFELRYDFGYAFLDRCGRMFNSILKNPDWSAPDDPNPQGGDLRNKKTATRFNVGTKKLDLAWERKRGEELPPAGVQEFADQAGYLTELVVDTLELSHFGRMGFRAWHLFPAESTEVAVHWIHELGAYAISESLAASFGGTLHASSAVAVIAAQDRSYRIAISPVHTGRPSLPGEDILKMSAKDAPRDQRKILKKQDEMKKKIERDPLHASMIDIDTYVESPEAIDPKGFIESCISTIPDQLKRSFEKGR